MVGGVEEPDFTEISPARLEEIPNDSLMEEEAVEDQEDASLA